MSAIQQRRYSGRWLAWLFLVVGLVATTAAWWAGKALIDREIAAQLDARVAYAKNSLEGQISAYTEVLRGYQAQFAAHTTVSEAAFRQTSSLLDLERRWPGIQAVGYSPRAIPGDTFLIQYIEPLAKNIKAVGFNQAANAKRYAAIYHARDTGAMAATDRLRLFIEPGNVDGLILVLPLYATGNIPPTQAERSKFFSGFVFLAIRVDDMLRAVFGPELLNDLAIRIHHVPVATMTVDAAGAAGLIFDSRSYQPDRQGQSHVVPSSLQRTFTVPVGGTGWQLSIAAQPGFIKASQIWLPWITAFVGVLLSLLTFLFIRTLNYARLASDVRTQKAEQSLHSSERQLAEVMASINEVLWTSHFPNEGINYVSPAVERVYGYPASAFYERPRLWLSCIHRQDRRRVVRFARDLRNNTQASTDQAVVHYRIVRSDGEERWLRYVVRLTRPSAAGALQINSVGSDISDEYVLHESLRRNHRALRAIHECNEKIATSRDKQTLLQGICEVMVSSGYNMAWVGMLQDEGASIMLSNVAGENQDYLDSIRAPLIHEPQLLSTIDAVLRTKRAATANNFTNEIHLNWRRTALRHGLRSKAALPLMNGEHLLGILNVYAIEEDAFDDEELHLLENLSQSLMAALQSLREREQRKAAEAALHLRDRAIEASASAIIIASATRPGYPVEYVNPAFERMTGYSAQDIIGNSLRVLHRLDSNQAGLTDIKQILSARREGQVTLRNFRKDGTPFWSTVYIAPVKDDSGAVSHFVAAKDDITQTKHYQDELEAQANHDALTGLANRKLLHARLRQAIVNSTDSGSAFWVVFLDLDRFKLINDSLGHRVGDQLLQKVASRIQYILRDGDTLARHGGDEFVLILPEYTSGLSPVRILQLIAETLAQPMDIEGHNFYTTCSMGVAVYPSDGDDPDMLIKHADIAMYRAKEAGRDNFQFFAPEFNDKSLDRLMLETDLRLAIERKEFVLYYQPQIDLGTGVVVGMEALIRWHHPQRGLIFPDSFIGIAEDTGMIIPIGNWAIRTACQQNKAWQAKGMGNLKVTVNLSARQFTEVDLMQSVIDILNETGLEPQYLSLELTESLVMSNVQQSISTLKKLKQLGVTISLDDFGTGYSSLSYLAQLPIDVLKVDRSFVHSITAHSSGAAIVIAIITLAHSLRLQVIAEGVETGIQLDYLRSKGCDQAQGYYVCKPIPAEEFQQFLMQEKIAYAQA